MLNQEPTPKTKSSCCQCQSKPWCLLGIIFVLAFGIFIGKYFFQTPKTIPPLSIVPTPIISPIPSTDPTSNWKTYTNNEYHFTVNYPSSWVSEKYTPTDLRIPYLANKITNYSIQFNYTKDEPGKFSNFDNKELIFNTKNQKILNINGITVYLNEDYQGNDSKYTIYTFRMSAGKYIQLSMPIGVDDMSGKSYSDEDVENARKIISTFKFTN
jgi:hypothetical protein